MTTIARLRTVLFTFFSLAVCGCINYASGDSTRQLPENTGPNIIESVSLNHVESQARNAAVKVVHPLGEGYGSGTYTIIKGEHVVLTAAHVVDDNRRMIISGRNGEMVVGEVIYTDFGADFAVIHVPRLRTRTPIPFKPRNERSDNFIGDWTTYTGFPSGHDLTTITGRIASIDESSDILIMHGYTWMGASGSGVFDEHGNYIGVLVAVDVGRYRQIPQIVEDMVWVVPVRQLNLVSVFAKIEMHSHVTEIPHAP